MSAGGISEARAMLSQLSEGLRAAASGQVLDRAAQAVQAQVTAVSKRILSKHVLSGRALSGASATRAGGLVQITVPEYVSFGLGAAWPFRSGMPPFVVSRAARIFQAELLAALAGDRSPLLEADDAAEEVAAVKSRAKFKADIARIYRHSAEGKAARSKERAAKRKAGKGPG